MPRSNRRCVLRIAHEKGVASNFVECFGHFANSFLAQSNQIIYFVEITWQQGQARTQMHTLFCICVHMCKWTLIDVAAMNELKYSVINIYALTAAP